MTAAYDAGMAANDFPDEDTRRFIVDATTGEAVPQPTEGFGSEDDAEAHLLDLLRGDPRLVVRAVRRR